jgi:hypothetical protein
MAQPVRDLANPVRDLFDATAHHVSLKITCRGCRRARIFPAASVWWLFKRKGWASRLREVAKHFRCRACGRRRPALDLVDGAADDDSLPMPSALAWKQELRRRR